MQMRKRTKSLSATRRLVLCAVFAAMAYAVMVVFHLKVQFLTFDLKDAVITVAGLLLGPLAALSISVLVAVLEFITVSDTALYGLIMNMASSVTFSVVASMVYKYRKRLSGAVVGLVSAVVSVVAVMLLLNLLVTPIYQTKVLGVPMSPADVAKIIVPLLLPFNAVKAVTNASLVLVFYKPLSRAMVAAGLLPRKERELSAVPPDEAKARADIPAATDKRRRMWISVWVTAVGTVLFIGALLFVFFVLDGQIEWFEQFRK